MSFVTLFLAELKYRLIGSLMAGVALAVAVLSVCTSMDLLQAFDASTDNQVSALKDRSQVRMDNLENEARVFSKSLGFNIFIYHDEQDLSSFYAEDRSTHFLTTEDTRRLAESNFALLNHHLPFLRQRYHLPAFDGDVIIAGIEGEIYIKQKFQQPLEVRIEPGQVQLGHTVATRLGKAEGDKVRVGSKDYRVTHVRSQLGTKDDLMLFMNLKDAQQLLGLEGKVSGILALSCNCAAGNVTPIRQGVRALIPHADVVEFAVRARARQRAREAIRSAGEQEIEDILETRNSLRLQLSRFSMLFVATVVTAGALLLFFLYSHNVKERRHEIAVLRTLGVRLWKVYCLFVTKAFLLAAFGTGLGFGIACWVSPWLTDTAVLPGGGGWVFLMLLIGAASAVSVLASLLPALLAGRQDPGLVLNEEG